MQTKNVSEELEQVMLTLQQQGKTPTVALVKSMLTSSIPMPAIVTAVRSWKGNKQVPKVEIAAEPASDESRIEKLEQQVKALTKRIAQLEAKQ